MTGSANRRRRQPEAAHHAGESRSARKQQTNPARTTRIRFQKVSPHPDSFLTPRRSPQNEGRTEVKGINFFEPGDEALLHALQDPRVNIAGIRRGDLLSVLGTFSPNRLSRQLRRLRDIGVIKRATGTCRYYLTRAGRAATTAACRITEALIVPAMI
jgi:hypothetical protein